MPKPPNSDLDGFGPVPADNQPGHHPDVEPDKPSEVPAAYRVEPSVTEDASAERFSFEFDPLLLPVGALVGVTPWTTSLEVADSLTIRFGPWRLETPVSNIEGAELTGPYNPLKIAGPPHLSFRDRGITFATNARRGVCIRFHEPVAALLPRRLLRHPAATVTVAAPQQLADRLNRR